MFSVSVNFLFSLLAEIALVSEIVECLGVLFSVWEIVKCVGDCGMCLAGRLTELPLMLLYSPMLLDCEGS